MFDAENSLEVDEDKRQDDSPAPAGANGRRAVHEARSSITFNLADLAGC